MKQWDTSKKEFLILLCAGQSQYRTLVGPRAKFFIVDAVICEGRDKKKYGGSVFNP